MLQEEHFGQTVEAFFSFGLSYLLLSVGFNCALVDLLKKYLQTLAQIAFNVSAHPMQIAKRIWRIR
jgi:methionine synthase I (cobalamin-dependent)